MVGREPGDAAFISSSRYRASSLTYPADRPREVRLPTYTGRIGEYLSIGWGLTLEVSTETLLDTIDQARFLLFRVTPISFLKTFTHSQVGLGMILSGDAKELDKLLAKLSQKLERSFAISERQENSFELLLDRHIRKDRRYEVLTGIYRVY